MATQYERVVAAFEKRGGTIKQTKKGVKVCCPVHGDKRPSLDVDRGDSGAALFQCRSNKCSYEDIMAKLDLDDVGDESPAVFPTPRESDDTPRFDTADEATRYVAGWKSLRGGELTTYDYQRADGVLLSRVLRFDFADDRKKQIRPVHLDETSGKWIAKGMPAPRPLYKLPQLLAASPDEPVMFVEGEKCATVCAELGFLVTTTSEGAGKAGKHDLTPLHGRFVCVLPDNDEAGRKHAADVVQLALAAGAAKVTVLELVGLEPGGDVADWVAARQAKDRQEIADELYNLVCSAPVAALASKSAAPAGSIGTEDRASFPVSVFPPACRAMAEAGAAAQGVDIAFWACPLIGILAGCIGATRRVRVKAGWDEPAVLWTPLIAVSGAGKSPPLRALLEPAREHDLALHNKSILAEAAYEAALDAWRANKYAGAKPQPPPLLAALVDDVTIEALAMRLRDNPRGLLLPADELAGWVKGWNQYRKGGGDEQRWLSIHNGDPLKVDRKSSPGGNPARIFVRRACVSVVGTIQPGTAKRYLGTAEQRESGMAARLLLAAPPIGPVRWTDRVVPDEVSRDYARVVRSLLDLSHHAEDPRCLLLDEEARAAFVAYHDDNGAAWFAAATDDEQRDIAAAIAKLRGAAPRIALVLALARAAESGVAELLATVNQQDMAGAITLVRWYESEARRIYEEWRDAEAEEETACNATPALAERLYEILSTGDKSLDDLHNATGKNLKGKEIMAALELLRAQGKAGSERKVGPNGGRPSEIWGRVSP